MNRQNMTPELIAKTKTTWKKDSKTKAKPMSVNLHSIISHWIGKDSGGSRGWALGTEGGGGGGAPTYVG